MNLRTTLVLVVLAVAFGVMWWVNPRLPDELNPLPPVPPAADEGTLEILDKQFQGDSLRAIEVLSDGRTLVSFSRAEKGDKSGPTDWSIGGTWPVRQSEVKELAGQLANLRSRFVPVPIVQSKSDKGKTLAELGLEKPAFEVRVKVKVDDKEMPYTLRFGEGTETAQGEFYRPAFVRLDDKREALRLGPGVLSLLGRPAEYYRQRRLFPIERVAKSPTSSTKTDQLKGDTLEVRFKEDKEPKSYTLSRGKSGWQLSKPDVDRLDPEKRTGLLEAVGDLWAERFVEGRPGDAALAIGSAALPVGGLPAAGTSAAWASVASSGDALLERTGLANPERTITVTEGGRTMTLQIGAVSAVRPAKAPPPPSQFEPPMPPPAPVEFRYARLVSAQKGDESIFEVRADKFRDIFQAPGTLRDARLARFDSQDVRKVEVRQGKDTLVLVRDDKDRWQVEGPGSGAAAKELLLADEGKVRELLDALSNLTDQGKDTDPPAAVAALIGIASSVALGGAAILPNALSGGDPFATPLATVTLTVKDREAQGDDADKKTKQIALTLGRHDEAGKQVAVKVDDWPRANKADDAVVRLVRRPALAYRGRLLDFTVADAQKIVLEQEGKKVALEQTADQWKLTVPAVLDADAGKAGQLADTLSRLEPIEYVAENPPDADLENVYGLAKAPLSVTVQYKGILKTLRVGKQRGSKPEYFARIDGNNSVFVVQAEVHDAIKGDALSYASPRLWRIVPDDVTTVRVEKEGADPFTLERKGEDWRVTGAFDAAAFDVAARGLIEVAANPVSERYETLETKEPATFGLKKPSLKVKVTTKEGPPRELILGGKVKDSSDRYGQVVGGSAVFVMRADVAERLDRTAIDYVDTLLLAVPLEEVKRIEAKPGPQGFVLSPEGNTWKVTDAPGAPFAADERAVSHLRGALFNLRAEKWAAFGAKTDLKKYGLEAPAGTLTVQVKDKTHTLELGGEVEGKPGQRYVRLDKGPGVAILNAADTRAIARDSLGYVNHRLLSLDVAKVLGVEKQQGGQALELVKKDGDWRMTKPADQDADEKSVGGLLKTLTDLRAGSIVEYPLKDPKKYGLDAPFAVITLRLEGPDPKPARHVVTLGAEVPGGKGERYARVDESPAVGVLAMAEAQKLAAGPLFYRERKIVQFADADKVLLERGPRRATLARVGGNWSMTEPLQTKVDHDQLEELLGKVAKLEADEWVAENPADLKSYGLDRPSARWRFQQDGKNELDLLLGKKNDDGRVNAKLANGNVVFLLSADLSNRLLTEYRPRQVWTTPPDVVQVDSIKWTRAGKTVELKREGPDWKVVGKPELKLVTETVNDTLDAFAGLKLERYAADKGADLKLYGLEPPEVVIELVQADKKVTLHLGRFEAESKRAYARVPEADRTDVMVLPEEDTARLLRDAEAFTKALPRKPTQPPVIPMMP